MQNRSPLYALLALACAAAAPAANAELSEVRPVGRVTPAGDGRLVLEWPGTGFETRVIGRGLRAQISDTYGDNFLDVEVDGVRRVIDLNQGPGTYTLYSGEYGEHVIRVTRRNGPQSGAVQIIDVRPDGRMEKTEAPERKILAIGGSTITGFGVLGADQFCSATHADVDVNLAHPTLVAKAFGADIHTVAVDGHGLVRNESGGSVTMDRKAWLATPNGLTLWPTDTYVPDVVIVSLGVGDFTADLDPPGFEDAYTAMLRRIRSTWPDAHVFATFGGALNGANYNAALNAIRSAVADLELDGDDHVHFQLLEIAPSGRQYGCNWQLGVDSHRHMADALAAAIMKQVAWKPVDSSAKSAADAYAQARSGGPSDVEAH